jgi:hypothetical protein
VSRYKSIGTSGTSGYAPLDVSVYSAFKGYYDAAVQAWLLQHPGLLISIYEIASCVNTAFERSMTPSNIRSGFRRTGIYPFDKFIFTDDDFALSQVTDRELKNNTTGDEEIMNRVEMENTVSTSNRTDSQQENLEIDKATTSQNVLDKKEDKKLLSPQEFRGYPKDKERKLNRKPRERGRSFIPTDTPEKGAIEEKHNEKMRKQALKNSKQLKRKIMDNSDSSKKEEFIPDDSSDDADWFKEEPLLCLTKELDRPPKVGDYVLVEFFDKKKIYFVGVVTRENKEENEYEVKFLRRSVKYENSFVFPLTDDISCLKKENIKFILPKPTHVGTTKRQKSFYKFEINFSTREVR